MHGTFYPPTHPNTNTNTKSWINFHLWIIYLIIDGAIRNVLPLPLILPSCCSPPASAMYRSLTSLCYIIHYIRRSHLCEHWTWYLFAQFVSNVVQYSYDVRPTLPVYSQLDQQSMAYFNMENPSISRIISQLNDWKITDVCSSIQQAYLLRLLVELWKGACVAFFSLSSENRFVHFIYTHTLDIISKCYIETCEN